MSRHTEHDLIIAVANDSRLTVVVIAISDDRHVNGHNEIHRNGLVVRN